MLESMTSPESEDESDEYERSDESDDEPSNSSVRLLDPTLIRYTRETIPAHFDSPPRGSVRSLAQQLKFGVKNWKSFQPIKVFQAFNEYWVTDGNRRVWAFREAKKANRSVLILAEVDHDDDAFLEEIRKDRPWMSVIDILQMGEDISLAA
jgi:hypothetical protein